MLEKKYGKTIKLFLPDGDPDGRVICELSNWTGKAFRIPRGKIKDCSTRQDLKTTAVYLLFGKAESSSFKPKVYIGEAENAFDRLTDHLSKKEFWNEAVVFISKDENLNKAHIKYLESVFHENAVSADRFEVQNDKTPTKSSISESDQSEMEEFFEYVKIIINTIGYKIFEPILKKETNKEETFYIKATRGASASGKRVSEGFVVLKNSKASFKTVPSYPMNFQRLRDELIKDSILINENNEIKFSKDYLFSSPSAAASVIMGRSANGLTEWKDKCGKSLKEIEAIEIKQPKTI